MNTSLKDTHVSFFSVTPSKKFFRLFERAGIQNVLISYHYIRQNLEFTKEILEKVREWGGLFMTDSGAFSFLNDKEFDAQKFDWEDYLIEYTDWLSANREYIFTACNLDVDSFVDHDTVQRWNKIYFKPLEEHMNICYVAHPLGGNRTDMTMVKEYCKEHRYVAVSEEFVSKASDIYQMAKKTNTAIHGLAWTKPTILKDFPFFSVDSSSWVNYQKFGATVSWDGVNFMQYDMSNKGIRRTLGKQAKKYGVSMEEFCTEKNQDGSHNDDEGLTFSLCTWKEVLDHVKIKSKLKIKTTVGDLLEGKLCVFKPKKEGGLANLLAEADARGITDDFSDNNLNEYATDEESGQQVAVYKKRDGGRLSIVEFEKDMGSSMFCSNCYIADKCPKFLANSACAFDFAPDTLATLEPLGVMDYLIKAQMERVNRAMFLEKMEGGLPNKTYTSELSVLQRLNQQKAEMIIKAQNSGARLTVTTTIEGQTSGQGGGGLMSVLAAALAPKAP